MSIDCFFQNLEQLHSSHSNFLFHLLRNLDFSTCHCQALCLGNEDTRWMGHT
jgi:hypothetical protein